MVKKIENLTTAIWTSRWLRDKESTYQCRTWHRRTGFDPWDQKDPLEEGRATPIFLPGESPGQRGLVHGVSEPNTTEWLSARTFWLAEAKRENNKVTGVSHRFWGKAECLYLDLISHKICQNWWFWGSRKQLSIFSSLCPRFVFLQVWPGLHSMPTPWSWEGKMPSTQYQSHVPEEVWCPKRTWKGTGQEKKKIHYSMCATQIFSNAFFCLWLLWWFSIVSEVICSDLVTNQHAF